MTKRIIVSLAMIALVIAGVTSATIAYFSNTATSTGNTFTMGTVDVEHIGGLPYILADMIPGEQRESGIITVQNTGSISIDLYIGEKDQTPLGDTLKGNFIGQVDYAINEVLWDGTFVKTWVNWQDVSFLFSAWNKVGENIPAGEYRYYKVYITPNDDMSNAFQGKHAINDVFIHAVQAGYSAPDIAPWIYEPEP